MLLNEYFAIIPARGGSKGIPNKNIAILNGKPLIHHTLLAAIESNFFKKIIVSTDSEEIANIARRIPGVEIPELRPPELAQDSTPTLPVIQHTIKSYLGNITSDSYVFILQPTSPLRTPSHLIEAKLLLESISDADSLVSIQELPHNFHPTSLMSKNGNWVKSIEENAATRRQDKPVLYARNGASIYATKAHTLLSNHTGVLGKHIIGYKMDKISSLDIDEAIDIELAQSIMTTMSFDSKEMKWSSII